MMPGTPPALATPPQFTTAHWDRVARDKVKVKLVRITKMDEKFTEFVFENGQAFQRRTEGLNPDIKLHVNLVVFVETIQGQLVTGMWVPEQGWVFRMTSEELADYAKSLSTEMHNQRLRALEELKGFVALALLEGIKEQVDVDITGDLAEAVTLSGPIQLDTLAQFVMDAMETAKSAGAR